MIGPVSDINENINLRINAWKCGQQFIHHNEKTNLNCFEILLIAFLALASLTGLDAAQGWQCE